MPRSAGLTTGAPPWNGRLSRHLPALRQQPGQPVRRNRSRSPGHSSQSERDWAEVRDQLREGAQPAQLIEQLARQRQDKPNPAYYASRTVERAADSLPREEPSIRRRGHVPGAGRLPRQHSPAPAYANSPSLADSGERTLPMQLRPDGTDQLDEPPNLQSEEECLHGSEPDTSLPVRPPSGAPMRARVLAWGFQPLTASRRSAGGGP